MRIKKFSGKTRKNTFIVTLLGVTLFFVACKNDIEKVDAVLGENVKYPNQSADSIETIYSDSGVVKLKLKAPKLLAFDNEKEPYVEFPEGIDVLFYNGSLEVDSRITAGYAIWKTKQNVWEARENVVVNNFTDGMKLNTELLIWDQQKEKIYSNKFVRITTKEEVIWGTGLEANQNLTQYRILKIKGDLSVDEE